MRNVKEDLLQTISGSSQREGIIEKFLANRCQYAIPDDARNPVFWKLLCYEIMYLWNLLGSCSAATLGVIVEDCKAIADTPESILGLPQFLMGAAYAMLNDHESAMNSYKACIAACNENPSNLHLTYIPAYACYELAVISLKVANDDSRSEAQRLIQSAQIYKNYDFEHRLKLKIYSLKIC